MLTCTQCEGPLGWEDPDYCRTCRNKRGELRATIYAVRWTKNRAGVTAEFHYADRRQAEKIARRLRRGWRRDAHVVTLDVR